MGALQLKLPFYHLQDALHTAKRSPAPLPLDS